ncbi:MAG: carbohydrate ABC transporter permease, partial [Gemmatimonadales bacterium]
MTFRWERWLFGALLAAFVAATLFPFYWAIVASLTPDAALFREPSLFPKTIILDHYRALFDSRDFLTPIRNSLVVAGTTTAFCLAVGTLAAYSLARLDFRGKTAIMSFILAVTMFPQISIVSPLYMLLRSLHLIDTYPGLIMPYMT